jgi:hypothetical protein
LVPVRIEAAEVSGFDITPDDELLPEHGYVLFVDSTNGLDEIHFETAADRYDGAGVELSVPDLDIIQLVSDSGTCGTLGRICASGSPTQGTSLEVRYGTEVLSFTPPMRFERSFGQRLVDGDCLSVRARDAAGRRSAARRFCTGDLATLSVEPSDTCESVMGSDNAIDSGSEGSGCSVQPARGGSTGGTILLVWLGALWRRRSKSP